MIRTTIVLVLVALVGCDRAGGSEEGAELSGAWEGVAGGEPLQLSVSDADGGVTGIADWGGDQYTVEGTHDHPSVSLALRGPFTQTRVVSLVGTFSDSSTIEGTLGTPGFPDQPVTLRRGGQPAP